MFESMFDDLDFENVFEFVGDERRDIHSSSSDSDSSQETNFTEENSEEPLKKKRKKYYQSTVVIPRLLMSDIRRSYANMFINTLNASDFPLFFEFLSKYSAKDITFYQEPPGCTTHSYFEFNGLRLIGQYFYNRMQAIPDSVHSLPSYCKVVSFPDTTSKIVACMEFVGTRIFDVGFDFILPHKDSVQPSENDMLIVNRTTSKCIGTIDGSICDRLQCVPMLGAPVQLKCTLVMTMHLNTEKEIQKLELVLPKRRI